jgi:tRNA(Ile)-lysidine synthase
MLNLNQLDQNYTYLIAVSGGSDSIALLDILYKKQFKLHIVHVNYKTRLGSEIEQQIVESYATKHNIPISIMIAPKHQKGNFENFAREVRYNFFAEVYFKINAKGLFIAHQFDDLLETYLIQKQRRSIVSYYGLKDISDIKGMKVYRPLLEYTKKQLEDYCHDNNIDYHVDESNLSTTYTRNRLRIETLSKYSHLDKLELLNKIKHDNDLIAIKEQEYVKNSNECIAHNRIDLEKFKLLSLDDKIYLLYKYIQKNSEYEKLNLSKSRLIDLIDKLISSKSNMELPLNKKFVLLKEYSSVFLSKTLYNTIYKYVCNEDEYPCGTYFMTTNEGHPHEGVYVTSSDFPLTIRPYLNGDKIQIKNGYKKVNRVFIDNKIPLSMRKVYPMIVNKDGEILLIPNLIKAYSRHHKQDRFFIKFIYRR